MTGLRGWAVRGPAVELIVDAISGFAWQAAGEHKSLLLFMSP